MKIRIVAGLFLAVAAFAAQGAVPAAAAEPAQVPCSPGERGRVYCNFWVPGDGYSAGSPVVEGPYLVGYLPKGRNWILCQEEGPVTYLHGYPYYNKWFAWTTAENGNQGWVNAVAASGGDNNGKFSNTPSCNGVHGSPF